MKRSYKFGIPYTLIIDLFPFVRLVGIHELRLVRIRSSRYPGSLGFDLRRPSYRRTSEEWLHRPIDRLRRLHRPGVCRHSMSYRVPRGC
jgi:hypothetical protein